MGTQPRSVGELGEFGLIAELTAGFAGSPAVLLGPGDDAAIVAASDGRVVASTDLLAEGVHFRRDWSSARDVGHKAAAANLADIAAMGAEPTALLVAMTLPADLRVEWPLDFAVGMAAEAALVGAAIVGGDISRGDTIVVAVTALGDLRGRTPLLRSGARPGDVVAVNGRLGWSAVGFRLVGNDLGREHPEVASAHRRPSPRYGAGPEAASLGATALIDVSDGLLAELRHIAVSSGVAIDVDRSLLTPEPLLRAAATAVSYDPVVAMLTGGEDHALLGTFPASAVLPGEWRVIGRVSAGTGVTVDGATWTGADGWEHF
jgi:thiamine-monophosphate kinase